MDLGDDRVAKAIRIRSLIVFHVSKLQANLLSLRKLLSNGLNMRFHVNECIVKGVNGNMVAVAQHTCKLYQMTFMEICGVDVANFVHLRAGVIHVGKVG